MPEELKKKHFRKLNLSINKIKIYLKLVIQERCNYSSTGTNEGIAFIEEIMENIARVTNQDPLSVRLLNMTTANNPLPNMIQDLKQKSNYDARRQNANTFNLVIFLIKI